MFLLLPGFGKRGSEGKILSCKYARENNIPFLGICLGLQCAGQWCDQFGYCIVWMWRAVFLVNWCARDNGVTELSGARWHGVFSRLYAVAGVYPWLWSEAGYAFKCTGDDRPVTGLN